MCLEENKKKNHFFFFKNLNKNNKGKPRHQSINAREYLFGRVTRNETTATTMTAVIITTQLHRTKKNIKKKKNTHGINIGFRGVNKNYAVAAIVRGSETGQQPGKNKEGKQIVKKGNH